MAAHENVVTDQPIVMMDMDAHPPALAAVRRRISESLSSLSPTEAYAVLLVVTELVTNAYEHAWFPCQIRLRRLLRSNEIRVEVDDVSPYPPMPGRSWRGDNRGHGLRLVEHFATSWGMIRRSVGKTVWAQISLRR